MHAFLHKVHKWDRIKSRLSRLCLDVLDQELSMSTFMVGDPTNLIFCSCVNMLILSSHRHAIYKYISWASLSDARDR